MHGDESASHRHIEPRSGARAREASHPYAHRQGATNGSHPESCRAEPGPVSDPIARLPVAGMYQHRDGVVVFSRHPESSVQTTYVWPPGVPGAAKKYLTPDMLGTPRVVTDAAGGVLSRHDYKPCGEELFADGTVRSGRLLRRTVLCKRLVHAIGVRRVPDGGLSAIIPYIAW